jgi:hypothetical protein
LIPKIPVSFLPLLLAFFLVTPRGAAQPYLESPIRYWDRPVTDVVDQWADALERGETLFDDSSPRAYLRDVLDHLEIPVESQVLVFSNTSFQNDKIEPKTPRALYFNQDHYVGWVQGGDIEIATFDRRVGMNFYELTVPRPGKMKPEVIRTQSCLACHAGSSEANYPAPQIFSSIVDEDGAQLLRGFSESIDHRSPLSNRWGGWYVTGQWEGPRHRGNALFVKNKSLGPRVTEQDTDFGVGMPELSEIIDTDPYLVPTSDTVALMVMEHQNLVHQRVAGAFVESRIALWNDPNYMSGEPILQDTAAVLDEQVNLLLEAFLFQDEASLAEHKIGADSPYREVFERNGVYDSQGRSLRELDLEDRMFKYRLSYMVYSDSFKFLHDQVRERFWDRIREIMNQPAGTGDYPDLGDDERATILAIVEETIWNAPEGEETG